MCVLCFALFVYCFWVIWFVVCGVGVLICGWAVVFVVCSCVLGRFVFGVFCFGLWFRWFGVGLGLGLLVWFGFGCFVLVELIFVGFCLVVGLGFGGFAFGLCFVVVGIWWWVFDLVVCGCLGFCGVVGLGLVGLVGLVGLGCGC